MVENIRLSFQGIWSHKMRSFLTMLGVIIGIASIIAIVSTIEGTNEQIMQNLIGAGNNNVKITLRQGEGEYWMDNGAPAGVSLISQEQRDQILALDDVENASFFNYRSYVDGVTNGKNSLNSGKALGVDLNYLDTCGYALRSGRAFVQSDYDNYRKVALVDSNAAENIFPGEDPVGKIIEIGEEPYTVVGVVNQDEDSMPNIENINQFYEYFQSVMGTVMIPSKCWPIAFQFDEPENIVIRADSTDNMSEAGNGVAKALNNEIKAADSSTKFEYRAKDVMQKVKNLQKLSESTNQQLIWIASISLLVGGIGVMNIMLVSVTERTKEIGLKKAIGARKKTILNQFLTEAAVLTSIGGIIGVVLGIALSKVVSKVAGSPTAISVPAIVGSVVFSMLIGIIFGLLPSVKAANLNPIDALRSE